MNPKRILEVRLGEKKKKSKPFPENGWRQGHRKTILNRKFSSWYCYNFLLFNKSVKTRFFIMKKSDRKNSNDSIGPVATTGVPSISRCCSPVDGRVSIRSGWKKNVLWWEDCKMSELKTVFWCLFQVFTCKFIAFFNFGHSAGFSFHCVSVAKRYFSWNGTYFGFRCEWKTKLIF